MLSLIAKMFSMSRSTYSAILKYIFFVYPITHFGVIVLFSSNFQTVKTFRPLFQNVYEIYYKFKHQICSVCQDLPTLQL
jgi:hypothetical protein